MDKNSERNHPHGPGMPHGTGEKAKDFKEAIKRLFKELGSFKSLIMVAIILAVLSSILSILAPNKLSDLTDEITKGLAINQENMNELNTSITKNITALGFIDSENINSDESIINKMNIDNLSEEMISIMFNDLEISGNTISAYDQYQYLKIMSEITDESSANEIYQKIDELPESIQKIIKPTMNTDTIKKITLFLVALYVCSSLFNYIQSICMTNVANKFANKLRSRIAIKINQLPLKYFDKHQSGDTLSRVTNDVDMIAQSMNHSIGSLSSSTALFFGTVIMMFYTNWIMAITAIGASLIGFAGMILILKNSQKYFVTKQNELGKLNGHIEEIYSGLNIVNVYNGKEESLEQFNKYNQSVNIANKKSQFLSGLMQPIMGFIGNFGYVAVCIVGAILTQNDIITFGVIVAFISYVRLFTSPLSQIAQGMTQLQSTAAASERVFEFLDEEEMSNQEDINIYLDKKDVKGRVDFENVVFQYEDSINPTIKNFTASSLPGQKIAIVGPTGAGKTTMVNLLMKFYEINGGNIKIDGVPISSLSRENIHGLFTMVLQDTWLFDGTVMENIIYNRENVSKEEVVNICKKIGLDHFIRTLPNGYETHISDSDNVSAGQRQLLTIARGMVEETPFLILDEATSNVDTRTEELVQKAMDKLTEGRTSFIIAHRLSTIKNADLILVMKDGNIIEQGNHEELMKQKGFYADLYNSQFQLN